VTLAGARVGEGLPRHWEEFPGVDTPPYKRPRNLDRCTG
jgi:hypothetical protein